MNVSPLQRPARLLTVAADDVSTRNRRIRRPIVAIVSAGVAALFGACGTNAGPQSSAAGGTTALGPTMAAPITTAPTSAAATTADATSTSLSPATSLLADHHTWIAYQSNRTGREGIWLIHPDGSENHSVAADVPGEEKYGNWSPDGAHLVFTTRGGETEPLYVYDLGSNTSEQLFQCNAPCLGDDEPVYSPDGAEVAFIRALGPFVHDDATGNDVPTDCGLWIGDVATRAVHQITSNTDPPCDREYFPGWSPDGKHITYWRDPYANGAPTGTAVYTIDRDGTNETHLTDPTTNAGDPAWSPNGRWIVFSTYPLNEYNLVPAISNLYRTHPDGTGLEQLTHYDTSATRATIPRYTPDGKWIMFTAVLPNSRELWAIPADGGDPIVIIAGGIQVHGMWQPNAG
jgi:Tol biopolymer transport system component